MRMLVLPLMLAAAVALVTDMKVAIEIGDSSAGRIPPNACYRIDSLCDAQGWEDSIVIGTDIDEASELAEYSVVVTGDVGAATTTSTPTKARSKTGCGTAADSSA